MSAKLEINKYIGHMSQIAGTKSFEFNFGKAKGLRAIEVNNGTGLRYTILVDKGLDLAFMDYKGVNLSFISKTGLVAPSFYDSHGDGFLECFTGGMLTTCGLTYMGSPCIDEGEELGMHGRISNCPAENYSINEYWKDDEYYIEVTGKVRQAKFFKENIVLTRTIITKMGENRLKINDKIENCGFEKQPFMLLYHFNFGYPLICEKTKLYTSKNTIQARDDIALSGIDRYNEFQAPTPNYKEQVFYHTFDDKIAYACLFNEKLSDNGLGAYLKYDTSQLPYLIEWKQMGESDYVVGLEPSTWLPEGRDIARKKGELMYINPNETKEFDIEFGITSTPNITI